MKIRAGGVASHRAPAIHAHAESGARVGERVEMDHAWPGPAQVAFFTGSIPAQSACRPRVGQAFARASLHGRSARRASSSTEGGARVRPRVKPVTAMRSTLCRLGAVLARCAVMIAWSRALPRGRTTDGSAQGRRTPSEAARAPGHQEGGATGPTARPRASGNKVRLRARTIGAGWIPRDANGTLAAVDTHVDDGGARSPREGERRGARG